jgi:hypothetical protein
MICLQDRPGWPALRWSDARLAAPRDIDDLVGQAISAPQPRRRAKHQLFPARRVMPVGE